MKTKISHIIFDLDGVLLDTEPFYTQVTQKVVSRYNQIFDWSLKSKMMGKQVADSAKILIETLKLPLTIEEFIKERDALLEELFPLAPFMPGAVHLTRHLFRSQIPQAIATSSSLWSFQLKTLKHKAWLTMFDSIVTGEDPELKNGKPSPDIFLLAAERLKASPGTCLVFEDSPAGVAAAKAASMPVVAVPDPNLDRELFNQADYLLDSLEDFEPELWGLPPF